MICFKLRAIEIIEKVLSMVVKWKTRTKTLPFLLAEIEELEPLFIIALEQ